MLKNKVEALLFAAGAKMDIDEISKLTRSKIDKIKEALVELKQDYDDRDTSLMLVSEGDSWKISVKEQHLPLVRNIVTQTELSKTVMETLAVIAFKYPIKQSDLIAIRTNKAYDHLKELEGMGYITRQKHGRTNLIKLTQKFFEYFDLREEQLKDKFKDFRTIADAIENKEKEIEEIKEKQREMAKDEKTVEEQEAAIQDQIESLEEYDSSETRDEIMKDEQKLGELEVVDEPSEEEIAKERDRIKQIQEAEEEKQEIEKGEHTFDFDTPATKRENDMEDVIDQKIEEMMHPKTEGAEEEQQETEPETSEEAEEKTEEQDLLEAAMDAGKKRQEHQVPDNKKSKKKENNKKEK